MKELSAFFDAIRKSFSEDSFVKITLSKPSKKTDEIKNVYVRLIEIKNEKKLSFTYRYLTRDEVKNYSSNEGLIILEELLEMSFKIATLFTLSSDYSIRISKKGKTTTKVSPPSFSNKLPVSHNQTKKKRVEFGKYLQLLGIMDDKGNVIPKMSDKFKQINKYLEIIEHLMDTVQLPKKIRIVDMGSGKGYLTFALYDFLKHQKNLDVNIIGIEQRSELVDYCNDVAKESGFENLEFRCSSIDEFETEKADVLIALHACDTATDDAIFKGLKAKSRIIICAPCCHKQIRQQLKGKEHKNPILRYGIFKERQFEMVTDTIRALILEKFQYQTKIFEFVSNEHTRKNVMLVGLSSSKKADVKKAEEKIGLLKKEYDIDFHYLEKLIEE